MEQRTWDQAMHLLQLVKDAGWDAERVQTLFKNWGLHADLNEALRTGRLSSGRVRAFLAGEYEPTPTGRIIDLRHIVQLLIRTGYHKATNAGQGMTASAYRKLWPEFIHQPPEYAGRFNEVILVDRTVGLQGLVRLGGFKLSILPGDCFDYASNVISGEIGRYIAFVQLGEKNLGWTVENCRNIFAPDEVGLTAREGLHLPAQHQDSLRHYGVDLPGSACGGGTHVPYVDWFDGGRWPYFRARRAQDSGSRCGSASRGIKVISVT